MRFIDLLESRQFESPRALSKFKSLCYKMSKKLSTDTFNLKIGKSALATQLEEFKPFAIQQVENIAHTLPRQYYTVFEGSNVVTFALCLPSKLITSSVMSAINTLIEGRNDGDYSLTIIMDGATMEVIYNPDNILTESVQFNARLEAAIELNETINSINRTLKNANLLLSDRN